MNENEIKQAIKIIIDKLIIVENNRLIYKQLTEFCGIGKQFECVIEKSKCFWVLTIHSLKFTAITELAKIYDEHSDAFGIKKLIDISSQNIVWFSKWYEENKITHKNFIESLYMKYDGIKEKKDKLKKIRDTELAHIDRKNMFKEDEILEVFTWGDIEDLIESAKEILDSIFTALMDLRFTIELESVDDIEYLIKNAYKGMKNIKKINN